MKGFKQLLIIIFRRYIYMIILIIFHQNFTCGKERQMENHLDKPEK